MYMGYIITAIVACTVIILLLGCKLKEPQEKGHGTETAKNKAKKARLTDRRKLKEILGSENWSMLTEWEKTFCAGVDKQRNAITPNQSEKIEEIWCSIKYNEKYLRDCEHAFHLLREIIESPAFEKLSEKEKKYMRDIYDEGHVSGSYRLKRIQEVHSKILKRNMDK
jgi:hypothetical protein